MATYDASAVSDSVIAHQKGITLQQGRALRDNPIAIAEGSADAPVIQQAWHPYDMSEVGDGNDGVIWNYSSDGTVSSIETPDFEDGYEYRVVFKDIQAVGPASSISVQVYRQTSAAYTTAVDIISATLGTTDQVSGVVGFSNPMIAARGHFVTYVFGGNTSSATTGVVSADLGSSQKASKAKFNIDNGGLNSGQAILLRRRDPLSY